MKAPRISEALFFLALICERCLSGFSFTLRHETGYWNASGECLLGHQPVIIKESFLVCMLMGNIRSRS